MPDGEPFVVNAIQPRDLRANVPYQPKSGRYKREDCSCAWRIVPGPATEVCGIKRGRYKSHHEPYNVISLPCFPVQRIGGLELQIIPATE